MFEEEILEQAGCGKTRSYVAEDGEEAAGRIWGEPWRKLVGGGSGLMSWLLKSGHQDYMHIACVTHRLEFGHLEPMPSFE